MGLIFGYLYRRWGRVMPLIIAHTLIDMVAFVGYALLHGHVRRMRKGITYFAKRHKPKRWG